MRSFKLPACVLLALAAPLPALAGDAASASGKPVDYYFGLKLWNAEWNGNAFYTIGDRIAAVSLDSEETNAYIPFFSARYGDWAVSASYMSSTDFTLRDRLAYEGDVSRREADLNLSYFVLPSVSVGVGYKEVHTSADGGQGSRFKGPIVSLAATAPLGHGFGLYGSLARGWQEMTFSNSSRSADADYLLSEAGLAYSITDGLGAARSLTFTAGYRYQVLEVKEAYYVQGNDLKDITSGLALSTIIGF